MHAPHLDPRTVAGLDDVGLVEHARRGDELAFRTIMERNNRRLYRVARAMLKDDSEAEDVVQESYLRAFAGLASFRGESSLATWLTRIVINEALGRRRKQRPTLALEVLEEPGAQILRFPTMHADTNPEQAAAQRQIRKLLEEAVDGLPEPFRMVFVMRDVEDMSIEETATALGIRPETVKTRLHRARRGLREALDERLASTLKDSFPFAGNRCARVTDTVLSRMAAMKPAG